MVVMVLKLDMTPTVLVDSLRIDRVFNPNTNKGLADMRTNNANDKGSSDSPIHVLPDGLPVEF
jgi:hypothetical protein